MQDDLRKLAQLLRQKADEYDHNKMVKVAQIIRGSVDLTLLKKKLGRG